jgi:hypothetical protein
MHGTINFTADNEKHKFNYLDLTIYRTDKEIISGVHRKATSIAW